MRKPLFFLLIFSFFFGGLSSGESSSFLHVDKTPTFISTLSGGIFDEKGNAIRSPIVIFSSVPASLQEEISHATLGTSSQQIIVNNPTENPRWTLTLSPVDGIDALWKSKNERYDINDMSGTDGKDNDSVGGKLLVDPTEMHILPKGGCSGMGISPGVSTAFSEDRENITLVVSGNNADTHCEWSLTNIALSQIIPAEQAVGNYSLDMMLTMVAF